MREEIITSDITVVGGGLAGICAAIAAARLGQTVSLVQNRPVLGGNSSSEIRVWVCGATKHGINRYARETGIMGELFVENQYRNPDGNPYLWDALLLEKVKAEANITLFLNTDVHEVDAKGDEFNRSIKSVTGWMAGSERRITFTSEVFLDCSGDGLIGFLAGAKFRLGRESKYEFNESLAPEESDSILLGSTILFYTRDEGRPVKFVPPSFAKDISQTPIPTNRIIRSGDSGCHYWWIEWGGEVDTVHDNEKIRDELWSVIYGIWDYIKNSGKFEAENLTLEWVGSIPGKREYRRFIGDYTLSQNDITEQKEFEDAVAFGGWSIDLHPPKGMYDTSSGAHNLQAEGNYHIPFRIMYSSNVNNLLFAGRNISATHIAFGTTRVMATCAVIGEAAGTGAALCVQKRKNPRGIYEEHLDELQQILLRQDASILGVQNQDPLDLALAAEVRASSTLTSLFIHKPDEVYPLVTDVGFIIPSETPLSQLEILLTAKESTNLEVEIWDTGKPQNYIPDTLLATVSIQVEKGEKQWVQANLSLATVLERNTFVVIKQNSQIDLFQSHQPVTGVLSFIKREVKQSNLHSYENVSKVLEWTMKPVNRKVFCFRIGSETKAYEPKKIINGFVRPYGGPNMWVSEPIKEGQDEWVELEWKNMIQFQEIQITFNDDVNEDLINLHHHRTEFEIIPELVRDYRIEAYLDGDWKEINRVEANRKRKRIHTFPTTIEADKVRVIVEKTNGCPRAQISEIRIYPQHVSLKDA